MTRTASLLLVIACLAAGSSVAETRVRAGEHSGFTRLVFYLPSSVRGWTASRAQDGYTIDIAPSPTSLDTSEVFSFIPRTRVRDIGLRDGQVWIGSDCDCHLAIFQVRPDVIAVDVRNGPDPADTAAAQAATHPDKQPQRIFPSLIGTGLLSEPSVPSLVEFAPPTLRPVSVEMNALAAAVARATSGGVLNPSEAAVQLDGPGIETRSALDRAEPDNSRRARTERCNSVASLEDLPNISPPEAWERLETATETNENPLAHALAYLSLGFGAEAAAAFAHSDLPADTALLLTQIAHSVDQPIRPASRALQSLRYCDGVPGLIGMLATEDGSDISEERSRDYVATLSRLPSPLRAHLAPRLGTRLEVAGFPDLALSARFTLERTQESSSTRTAGKQAGAGRPATAPSPPGMTGLPDTPFFQPRISGTVLDAIAAARFAQEDRILIEAWIQEAPSEAEADAATSVYVSALNRAGRPLDALSHLDARIGRRGALRPVLEAAVEETLDTAVRELGPGPLMLLDARLAERPWYGRIPQAARTSLAARVAAVRAEVLGQPARTDDGAVPWPDTAATSPSDTGAIPDAAAIGPESAPVSARRRNAEAAIASAADSLARSARLRTEAVDRAEAWARATP